MFYWQNRFVSFCNVKINILSIKIFLLFLNDTQKIENFREKKNEKEFYIIFNRLVYVLNHDSLNHDINNYLKKKKFHYFSQLRQNHEKIND